MSDQPHCMACGQLMPSTRLLCANCLKPIGRYDSWTHDGHSRAVHRDCEMPMGVKPVSKEKTNDEP